MAEEGQDPFLASLSDDGRYRLLVEAVTDYAIYMLDRNGIVASWNAGAARFKGYTPTEIIGQHFSRFYTQEDRDIGLPARALETAAREGRFENEGWRVRKDGSLFWASVVIDPIRDKDGALVGFSKVTRDLTERHKAEEALRRTEEQFRILIQGVTDYAIYMLDWEGRVTSWNAGAERIKGYAPAEIIGEHFSRFYTPEDAHEGAPQKALATAVKEGRYEKEAVRVRKDGRRFWAHVVIDPIRGGNGSIIGFAKITRDITEKREAQIALEKAREALLQSQKMDAIGQLTGGVAHDFNNLLMAIIGSIELVRKRVPDDPKIHSLLDNAIQGAQRGATLTKRMLAFARRQELKSEAIEIPVLVRGMTELLQRSLGPTIVIDTRFPLALPPVQADPNQLEMAVLNLAVNARDAMPKGGEIVISAREKVLSHPDGSLKPGRYLCLSLKDTGEGMDEATLARATEPFFTTKGPGKGTGLGLAMVHGLAEQSGGRFYLVSKKGQGTTAELLLPVAEESAKDNSAPASIEEASAENESLIVLAVDDDSLVLMNTVAMLEDLGHTVVEANDAKQALDILRGGKEVDLVVTDQAMPHMTGTQLADTIRIERPAMPILLATGYAELPPGEGSQYTKLSKPFLLDDLKKALAETIESRKNVLNFPAGRKKI